MNQTTSTLPSARIRRRHLRFSPSRLRQRFRGYDRAIFFSVWVLAGLSTYGLVWTSFWYPTSRVAENTAKSVLEEDASFFFSSLSNSKQTFHTHKQKKMKKDVTSKRLRKESSVRLKKYMEDTENEFTTIGFWIIFILWCYQKIKDWFPISTLPSTITERQPTRSTSPSTPPSQTTTMQIRRIHREVIVRTLQRINRERQERDEGLISVEAIEAFQNALLQDQVVFEGLPEQGEGTEQRNLGATQEEIDACVKRLPNEHDNDCECIICLTELDSSERKEMLRVLPCNHTFHACCIDKWFAKSTKCPICKASIRKEDASS
ncbi:unnamed protein product [Cylindrotheca closterium]|uniref:RING-type domain-containing protein n=1 Tax=Cylindrotheca closterium TaxID=2856 RepID=A0AAD2FJK2_9STRA|nr:unnamed protein product [Cylindrotheca closterium]